MGLTLAHEIELPHGCRNRQFRAGLPHVQQTTVRMISEAMRWVHGIVSGLIAKAIGLRATFMRVVSGIMSDKFMRAVAMQGVRCMDVGIGEEC